MFTRFASLSFCFSALSTIIVPHVSLSVEESRPNVVIIYVDDLDFDQISVYDENEFPSYTGAKNTGNLTELSPITANQNGRFLKVGEMNYYKDSRMLTPNIERIAEEGVRLDRFYLTSSTCTPSRYSLLTGRYASRAPTVLESTAPDTAPLIGWNSHLLASEGSLVRDLGEAGYRTGLVGKWHLSDYEVEGVDFNAGYRGYHKDSAGPAKLPHQQVSAYFPPEADYADPDVQEEVGRIYELMRQKVLDASGFDVVDRLYFANYGGLPIPEHLRVHNLEWLTEGALNFIEQSDEEPFLLYFSLTAPHGQYFEDWLHKDWRATPAGMLAERPVGMPSRASVRERVEAAGLPLQNAMATWIDDSVGAVLDALDAKGLKENTIVMFLSDHQSRGKLTVYEASRAPGLIRWPERIPAGSVQEKIVSNIDVRPSVLAAAGLSAEPKSEVDGANFFDLLAGKAEDGWREHLLLETGNSRAIVTEEWKYIANRPSQRVAEKMLSDQNEAEREGKRRHIGWTGRVMDPSSGWGVRFNADQDFPAYFEPDQLYQLGGDVFEQHNVITNPEHSAVLSTLKDLMNQEVTDLPRPFGEYGIAGERSKN